jgi:hypothetical protein
MIRRRTSVVDNRDADQMYEYLEARIEALKRRITELEAGNSMNQDGRSTVIHSSSFSLRADCAPRMAPAFAQRIAG